MTIDNQSRGATSIDHAVGGWKSYLSSGEKVLWRGRPNTGVRLRKSDIFTIPFSLIFAGFSIFWTHSVYNINGPVFMLLFGGMFVGIGVYLVVGRFFWDSYRRRHTYYTLTDKRAFVATNYWKENLRVLPITKDSLVDYQPGKESTIILQHEARDTGEGKTTIEHGFEFIDEGEKVFSLISKIQNGEYDKYSKY